MAGFGGGVVSLEEGIVASLLATTGGEVISAVDDGPRSTAAGIGALGTTALGGGVNVFIGLDSPRGELLGIENGGGRCSRPDRSGSSEKVLFRLESMLGRGPDDTVSGPRELRDGGGPRFERGGAKGGPLSSDRGPPERRSTIGDQDELRVLLFDAEPILFPGTLFM